MAKVSRGATFEFQPRRSLPLTVPLTALGPRRGWRAIGGQGFPRPIH